MRAGDRIGHRAWGGNGDCSHSQWCAGDRQLPSECAGGRSLPRGQRGCEGGAGDVASDEDCRQLAAAASEWGGLDILVNNASATKHVANPPPISIRSRGKALYVKSCHTVRFKDMSEAESASLLQYLFAHQQRPEFTCRFRWEVGSLAFWDNRCVQHNPINDYHGFRRVMHRVTLAGDRPR